MKTLHGISPLPKAYVSHRIDHRFRIQIPSKRGSEEYFARVEHELKKCKGVESVRATPLTGSILITHLSSPQAVGQFARENRLFAFTGQIPEERVEHDLILEHLSRGIEIIDRRIVRSTGGRLDLASLRILGLIGIAGYQLRKGTLFPPAYALIENALGGLRGLRGRRVAKRAEHSTKRTKAKVIPLARVKR